MFCPNCGEKLEDNVVFCTKCGTRIKQEEPVAQEMQPVEEPYEKPYEEPSGEPSSEEVLNQANDETFYQNPEEKQTFFKKHGKAVIGIVATVVVVLLLAKIITGIFSQSKDSLLKVYDSEKDESSLYLNGKHVDTLEGTVTIYRNMEEGTFYLLSSDGDAYYLNGRKLKEVMNDCEEILVANQDKNALLLNEDGELYRYNGSKLEEICDENVVYAAISGDGKYYSYTTINDEDSYESYIGNKAGKETKVEDCLVVACSENGKYFYGRDEDQNLIVVNRKGEKDTIAKDVDTLVGLNEDGTELMYVKDGGTYVVKNGDKKEKVSDDTVLRIYAEGNGQQSSGGFYPVKSFKKTIVFMQDSEDETYSVCKLSGSYEAEEIVEDISYLCGLKDNLSGFYYMDGSDLYYTSAKEDAEGKKLAEDVTGCFASYDGKDVYYMTEDEELCYIKGSGKAKVLDENAEYSTYTGYNIDGVLYIEDQDGDWYYVKGKNAQKLKVEAIRVDSQNNKVYGYKDEELYEINGKKLKPIKGDFESVEEIVIY